MSNYNTGKSSYRISPDEPRPWLMLVDDITREDAMRAGKALGSIGITGRFIPGLYAENMQRLQRRIFELESYIKRSGLDNE